MDLASLGDFAYFTGKPATSSNGLWKSDGTESGTVLVKEHLHASYMVSDGNSLYFHNGTQQLWMSDGTTSGTGVAQGIYSVKHEVVALF